MRNQSPKRAERGRSAHRTRKPTTGHHSPAPDITPAAWAHPRLDQDQGPAPAGVPLYPQMVEVRLYPPYYCAIIYRTQREHHLSNLPVPADGGLLNRHIEAGDILIFDTSVEPVPDGAITMVEDDGEWVARICRHTAQGPEFHPDAAGFPVLRGDHRTCGVLVGVVRDYRTGDEDEEEEATA